MKVLQDDTAIGDYREVLVRFLNDYGLVAPAILSLSRRTELIRLEPGENVLEQGKDYSHIFFLAEGAIAISIQIQDEMVVVGERDEMTLLGEISYFNSIPATATVSVNGSAPAYFLRVSYGDFTHVLEDYPQIKPALARIGEMRIISQKNGFCSYSYFMDMIGWKRDRLAINRPLLSHLERTIEGVLLPLFSPGDRLLDVGDGPGIVSEVIHERHKEMVEQLHIQATHLEEAILNPTLSYPSDFSRTRFLREQFQFITALRIFEHLSPDQFPSQFESAKRLLEPGGYLLVVRLRVVDVIPASGMVDTSLFFHDLQQLVQNTWPGTFDGEELVKVTFLDADLDPLMEWNPKLGDLIREGKLQPPPDPNTIEGALVGILFEQSKERIFNPEEIQFHLLVWHASKFGFQLEKHRQLPEYGFFFQLFQLQDAKR